MRRIIALPPCYFLKFLVQRTECELILAAGSLVGTGSSVIIVTAVDGSGNKANCSVNLVSSDTIKPALLCPAALNATGAASHGSIPNIVTSIQSSDNCPGVVISQVPLAGSVAPLGVTLINVTATDASGNTASCTIAFHYVQGSATATTGTTGGGIPHSTTGNTGANIMKSTNTNNSKTVGIVLGVLLPLLCIALIIAAILIFRKKKKTKKNRTQTIELDAKLEVYSDERITQDIFKLDMKTKLAAETNPMYKPGAGGVNPLYEDVDDSDESITESAYPEKEQKK